MKEITPLTPASQLLPPQPQESTPSSTILLLLRTLQDQDKADDDNDDEGETPSNSKSDSRKKGFGIFLVVCAILAFIYVLFLCFKKYRKERMKRSLDRAREQASEALEDMEEAGLGFDDIHGTFADDGAGVDNAGDDEDSDDDDEDGGGVGGDEKDRSRYPKSGGLVELPSKKASVPALVVKDGETDTLVDSAGNDPSSLSVSTSSDLDPPPPKSLLSPTAKEVL